MIWLIGNKGMLGSEIEKQLEQKNIPYIGSDREANILSAEALRDFAAAQKVNGKDDITRIINCAAYTAVDRAEDEKESAHKLNAEGAAHIATVAKELGASLLHISTDYVFDGTAKSPYTEDTPVCPSSVYGATKADGEKLAVQNNNKTWIIRTAWLYGKYGNNFVHTMIRLMNEKAQLTVVNDQKGTPTYAYDLARSIVHFVCAPEGSIKFGIYHFTNTGETTWYDFAQEIYRLGRQTGLITNDCTVLPCSTAEYPTKAKRPAYSVLSKDKIQTQLNFTIPEWRKSLKDFIQAMEVK